MLLIPNSFLGAIAGLGRLIVKLTLFLADAGVALLVPIGIFAAVRFASATIPELIRGAVA